MDEMFSMMFELEKINDVEEVGLTNMVDISVRGDETFHLANGIISHNSASGGLMPVLGRKEVGYFELKGKPLNAYEATTNAFHKNTELSDLYRIVASEDYEWVVFATDQDLDGFLIRGLMIGFFEKYFPKILRSGKTAMLETPIMAEIKNEMPVKWVYGIQDADKLKGHIKYYKGLGSWKEKALKVVVKKDGLVKMIEPLIYDDEAREAIDSWLKSTRADDRKEMLLGHDFDLIKM